MDVRCEKCLTVYEFDEAQVTPAGVTVKCTQCGNLFKVKRKETAEIPMGSMAARSPAYIPPASSKPIPVPVPRPPPPEPEPDPNQFLVRLALNGEVFKIYDLHMLKDWILGRKLTREDAISKEGNVWKPLGTVPELAPIFRELEDQLRRESSRPKPAPQPAMGADAPPTVRQQDWQAPGMGDVPLALTTTAPMSPPSFSGEPSGPVTFGDNDHVSEDPAFASTTPKQRLTPAALTIPPVVDELAELDLPPQKKRWPVVLVLVVLMLGGGAGYLAMFKKELVRGLFSSGSQKGQKALAEGRTRMLDDTDDAFRQASNLFAEAHGADEQNPLPLAGLAEAQATWAWYLREDARALDAQGPAVQAVAQSLRREAQAHLDDAKRYAADAIALGPDAPEVNRGMADFLRVDGAPLAEADRYLKRALDKAPEDPEAAYVAGALLYREGKYDDARTRLEQANTLAQTSLHQPLLRAGWLLARIAIASGKKDVARQQLSAILVANPQHDRAKALLATLETVAAPDAGTHPPDLAPAQAAQAGQTGQKPAEVAKPTDTPKPPVVDDGGGKAGNYNQLVAQADKLSVSGGAKAEAARKLYEKALALNPQGVEAITGLGYCDLDREKFMSAVERFKSVLAIAPSYGDALIGIAESYKIQGQKAQALEYYKKYLSVQPTGPKAQMAQKNIRDLEPPKAPPPEPERAPEKAPEKAAEPEKSETPLPHLPPSEQPPPP
jgi:predicted Zn finger-like uncharacterized protein